MAGAGAGVIMLAMKRTSTPSRLLLVADRRSGADGPSTRVRRFRLARLPVTDRQMATPAKQPAAAV
jgi:hypothetical protein